VLELLLQQLVDELADEPSAAEVTDHLEKARRGKAPGESGLAASCSHGLRGRGCSDGIFSLKMALLKRKEHGLGTWAL
jgi:hypothetical protein